LAETSHPSFVGQADSYQPPKHREHVKIDNLAVTGEPQQQAKINRISKRAVSWGQQNEEISFRFRVDRERLRDRQRDR